MNKNKVMEIKHKKARMMSIKAGKAAAIGESMNELKMGMWEPYHENVKADGLDMYYRHNQYMRKRNRKVAMA